MGQVLCSLCVPVGLLPVCSATLLQQLFQLDWSDMYFKETLKERGRAIFKPGMVLCLVQRAVLQFVWRQPLGKALEPYQCIAEIRVKEIGLS